MKLIILFSFLFSFCLWGQDEAAPEQAPADTNEAMETTKNVLDDVAKEMNAAKEAKEAKEKILKDAMDESAAPKEDWAKNMYNASKAKKEGPEAKAAKDKANSYSENIKKTIAPFQAMSIIELENFIKTSFKDSKYNSWFNKYPFFVTFIAEILRSSVALPSLAKMLDQKDKMAKMSVTLLFTFVIGMMMKKMVHAKAPFSFRVLHFFIRASVLTALRIGIVIYFFQEELTPAWKLFHIHVFKNFFF